MGVYGAPPGAKQIAGSGPGMMAGSQVLSGGGPSSTTELAPATQPDVLQGLTPQQVALFAAMLINGGNISRAAQTVGMNPSYARRIVSRHAVFREAIRQYGQGMKTCLQDWMELVPRAKQEMLNLLNDPDGKTRYLASKDILDRAEGKAINRMDLNIKDERNLLSEAEIQLAMSLMRARSITYAEAVRLIQANPEDTQAWIEKNAIRKPAMELSLPQPEPAEEQVALPEPVGPWEDASKAPKASKRKRAQKGPRIASKPRKGSKGGKGRGKG